MQEYIEKGMVYGAKKPRYWFKQKLQYMEKRKPLSNILKRVYQIVSFLRLELNPENQLGTSKTLIPEPERKRV